jgi:hypothetical protein
MLGSYFAEEALTPRFHRHSQSRDLDRQDVYPAGLGLDRQDAYSPGHKQLNLALQ